MPHCKGGGLGLMGGLLSSWQCVQYSNSFNHQLQFSGWKRTLGQAVLSILEALLKSKPPSVQHPFLGPSHDFQSLYGKLITWPIQTAMLKIVPIPLVALMLPHSICFSTGGPLLRNCSNNLFSFFLWGCKTKPCRARFWADWYWQQYGLGSYEISKSHQGTFKTFMRYDVMWQQAQTMSLRQTTVMGVMGSQLAEVPARSFYFF